METQYQNPASTVDLIVPCKEGIILIKRKHEPFKDYWALPGGFLDCEKETLEEAAVRELFEETNLLIKKEELKLIGVYSNPKRDPRGHVVSHVYLVKSFSGELKANDDAKEVKIFRNVPKNLAFDHDQILTNYFENTALGETK